MADVREHGRASCAERPCDVRVRQHCAVARWVDACKAPRIVYGVVAVGSASARSGGLVKKSDPSLSWAQARPHGMLDLDNGFLRQLLPAALRLAFVSLVAARLATLRR